jgi:hypothetical protein
MPDRADVPALSPREVAGRAYREAREPDSGSIPWADLPADRHEFWCLRADRVVADALHATVVAAVDQVARELYLIHHQAGATLTEWTMSEWDHGGDQHVNKEPWREKARRILSLVESTYRHSKERTHG